MIRRFEVDPQESTLDIDDWRWNFAVAGERPLVERDVEEILRQARAAGVVTQTVVGDRPLTRAQAELTSGVLSGAQDALAELEQLAGVRAGLVASGSAIKPVLVVLLGARPLFEADPEGWWAVLEACPGGLVSVLTVLDDVELASFGGSEALRDACVRDGAMDLCTQLHSGQKA